MRKIWCNKIVVIIDKTNMVSLDLLATINLYSDKAKALYKN